MLIHRRSASVWALTAVAVACSDPASIQPDTISGEVSLYDELGQTLPSADQVQVAALSTSSVRQYSTLTDASGWFELELPGEDDVPLMFSRDGFGDMFRFEAEKEAGSIHVDMFARSSASPVEVTAGAEACGSVLCLDLSLEVHDFFGAGTTRRIFRVYLSTDPELTFFDYQHTDVLVIPNDDPGLVRSGNDATVQLIGIQGLLGSFSAGARVHVLVYGATENLESSYPGPSSGLPVFTDLSSTSTRTSFILP